MAGRKNWPTNHPEEAGGNMVEPYGTKIAAASQSEKCNCQIPGAKTAQRTKLQIPTAPLHFAFFMAKTSWINRNQRKRATVKKYAAVRAELKAKKDYAGLAQLPRDASPTRVVNRCEVTGRRRAFIRRFKVSRLTFRELASAGLIPGVTKSSW
jgi:small subunit ribosomal protein S14